MRHLLGVVLLVLVSALAQPLAAEDLQLKRLESALDAVRHEQQAVYQQFQMVETLQRTELQATEAGSPAGYVPDGQIVNYDDAVHAKQERQSRLAYYSDQLQTLSARHLELENQSRALVEQIRILARQEK